jgi:hypothetical protein
MSFTTPLCESGDLTPMESVSNLRLCDSDDHLEDRLARRTLAGESAMLPRSTTGPVPFRSFTASPSLHRRNPV